MSQLPVLSDERVQRISRKEALEYGVRASLRALYASGHECTPWGEVSVRTVALKKGPFSLDQVIGTIAAALVSAGLVPIKVWQEEGHSDLSGVDYIAVSAQCCHADLS